MLRLRELKREKGSVLILCYIILISLLAFSAPLLSKLINEKLLLDRQKLEKEAFYLAEGAIDDAANQFINAIANFEVAPTIASYPTTAVNWTTFYTNSTSLPAGASVIWSINETGDGAYQTNDPDGSIVFIKPYKITAQCIHPENNNISVTLNQVVLVRRISAFQHAVFYNDDLEILPGPDMTFTGRIHSNKDIYLDSDGHTLTIDSEYLRSAANIYNGVKDGKNRADGTVKIKEAGTTNFHNMDGLDSGSADWLTESQNRWNGTVQSSVHGVTKLAVPAVGSIQPNGYYASNADVVIENGIIRKGGVVLVEGTDIPTGTIQTDTTFYNNRERKFVKMTNVDLKKLAGYAEGDDDGTPSFASHLPENGLIYATRDDALSNEQPGVRLTNGSQIYRDGGLTVVSNDPVYIQGNYNTENKQPAAIICDSVNLLSNNWTSDARSTSNLSSRPASDTTFNTAFIAGVDETSVGQYNGGLENYPRLHEDWSRRNLTINGAFIELWNPQIAQGEWHYGDPQYTAPRRDWHYESLFSDGNMPPFTPWAVEAEKGALWKE
ncbi:MAG: hypothetical protein DRP74_07680 [Candidatus Omnitrophota bacterium]|nr:MAG: hypothetical protein DRP74_07680 [Candidatus Omnitrophota bacterium]